MRNRSPGSLTEHPTGDPPTAPVRLPFPRMQAWGTAASVLLGLFAVDLVLAVDFLLIDLNTVEFLTEDLPVSETERVRNHARLVFASKTAVVAGVPTFLLWLVWLYQAQARADSFRLPDLRFSPVSAVASWFVPGVNLIAPCLVVRELWKGSDLGAGGFDWKRRRTSPLVWVWWLSFVAAATLAAIGFAQALHPGAAARELFLRDWLLIASCSVGALCLIVWIVLIQRIGGRQLLKGDQLGARPWSSWRRGEP